MDRLVNVRLFSVELKDQAGRPFSDAIQRIAGMGLVDREHELEPDLVIRLERTDIQGRFIVGEFVRRQTTNLPPRAPRGRPLDRLGVGSIGHTTAFVFDQRLSVLALQLARNGITPVRIALYVEARVGGGSYSILPIPNQDIWNRLRRGAVRGVSFKLSSPNELQAIDGESRSIRRGLIAMKESLLPARVEVTMSSARGDNGNYHFESADVRWSKLESRRKLASHGLAARRSARAIPWSFRA